MAKFLSEINIQELIEKAKPVEIYRKPKYVPGSGPSNAKMVFVGEAPGAVEDQTGIPFNGPSGDLLWDICQEVGIDRRSVYVTNVCKYKPPNNDFKRLKEVGIDIDTCISQLWDEITTINPNVIVALGNHALSALTGKAGILKWRGSCIRSTYGTYKVVPTIHPAGLLHSESDNYERKGPLKYSYRHIIKLDLIRALKHAESNVYDPPDKVVEIARDVVQLDRFLTLYKDKELVSVDIEAYKSIPFCIGIAFNNWHAMSIPIVDLWRVFKREEGGPSDATLAEMLDMLALLLESGIGIIGQNFKFDQERIERNLGIYPAYLHCDTSLLAHALHPEFPKSLEFNTSIYTEVPYYKEEGKEFDWKKDKVERILHYNGLDACVTFETYEEMMKDARELKIDGFPNWADDFCLQYMRELHYFYHNLEDVGFEIDLEKQKSLIKEYEERIKVHQAELDDLAGWHINVNSKPNCAVLVYNQLKYPNRKGTAEEVVVSLMANTKRQTPQSIRMLELILILRREKIALKKYFSASVDYDLRMRTSYTIAGTETGRSNTKILKPPVRPVKMGIPFQTITKHGEIGTEIREMFIADKNYVIVETDMSQAEARIVALLANDARLQKLFAMKADIHRITASWIFNIAVASITHELRFIGKTTRHAGNYDMGKHRLMELVNTEAKRQHIEINLSEYKAGKILDAFHAFSPNLRGVFHESVQKALMDNNRILVNPFGRYRQFFDRWGRDLFKEAYADIPQSTVPDHLRLAGMRAKRRFRKESIDARFALESHDALVGLVYEPHLTAYKEIMHEEIERPIDFSRCTIKRSELIIPADTKWGYNYKDQSKSNPDGLRSFKTLAEAIA